MKHHSLALAVTLALSATPVFAESKQSKDESIEKLVVVSNRIATPLREVATSVSVVTKDEINARGYATLTDVLRNEPSLSVTHSGGAGSTTSLSIRGEKGYRTQVRIDGIEISDPTGTQIGPQLAHLQSSNISRVEILRGPQGLAYGADAGGVINIQSGQYDETLAGSISGEFGRYDTRNLAANVGGKNEKFDYYLSASDYKTNGFNSRINDTSQDRDGYKNTTVHSRLGYQVNDALKLVLVARNTQGDGEYDSFSGAPGSLTNSTEQSNFRVAANYIVSMTEHEIAYEKVFVEREVIDPTFSDFFTKGTIERIEYIGQTELNNSSNLIYGFDWKDETITTNGQSRNNNGYYTEYQGEAMSNLFVTAGLRYDDNDDFGEHISYRLSSAYIWALGNGEIKLRGSYGTGFRAPSLSEVQLNSFTPLNNKLKEEQTKGYEAAVEYSTKAGSRFEAVYFDQDIDDSIFYASADEGYLQDIGTSNSKGIELIADVRLISAWSLTTNYTYNDATDTAGNQRRRIPKHTLNLGMNYNVNKWTIATNARLVKDRIDGEPLEDYDLFDLSVRYQVNSKLEVYARIENLFDNEYQDIAGYNTSGEAPHIGVRYQF